MTITVDTTIHAAIARARTIGDALILDMGHAYGPTINIHGRDEALAAKIAAAINGAIKAHAAELAQREAPVSEAAE